MQIILGTAKSTLRSFCSEAGDPGTVSYSPLAIFQSRSCLAATRTALLLYTANLKISMPQAVLMAIRKSLLSTATYSVTPIPQIPNALASAGMMTNIIIIDGCSRE